eukprot:UN01807
MSGAKTLFVVDFQLNWFLKFQGHRLADGSPIKVEQSRWGHFSIKSGPGKKITVSAEPEKEPWGNQGKTRSFSPDFCLIRTFPNDLRTKNYKNELIALMFASLPSVNSLQP